MRFAVLCSILGLVFAGCAAEPDKGSTPSTSGSASTSSTGPTFCCVPEESVRFRVDIDSSGPFAVAIPFPHLDWCLGRESWMNGNRTYAGVGNAEWREVERGHVLWIDGDGGVPAFHQAVLNVTLTPRCQTLRFDPWSIEPDQDNGAAEAFGASQRGRILTNDGNTTTTEDTPTTPANVRLTVEHVTPNCSAVSEFAGTVGNDQWTVLAGTQRGTCPP